MDLIRVTSRQLHTLRSACMLHEPGAAAPDETILYEAARDLAAPRVANARSVRIDRVWYSGRPLPSGELCRSIGHWNNPEQEEVFQLLFGDITMIIAESPDAVVAVRLATPGDLYSVPPGAWHATFAAEPSMVENIYAQPLGAETASKYHRREPLLAGYRWLGGQTEPYGLARSALSVEPSSARTSFWILHHFESVAGRASISQAVEEASRGCA